MGMIHLLSDKQRGPGEASVWADELIDDAPSVLAENTLHGDEPAFGDDEHTDATHSLLEENARLRGLLVQLLDLIRSHVVHAR